MKTRRPPEKIPMKRGFLIALLVSFASHALVLSMPVIGNRIMPPPSRPERPMTVELAEPLPPEPEVREAAAAIEPSGAGAKAARTAAPEEQTVNLESPDRRYRSYLQKVRQRIENRWSYPETALKKGEQGIATVKFTIENRGVLSGQDVLTSSGSSVLDEHSLAVVRAAAPYDRLPPELSLARLHIVASFHYRLKP